MGFPHPQYEAIFDQGRDFIFKLPEDLKIKSEAEEVIKRKMIVPMKYLEATLMIADIDSVSTWRSKGSCLPTQTQSPVGRYNNLNNPNQILTPSLMSIQFNNTMESRILAIEYSY